MCCSQLAANTGRKNNAKNAYLRTIAQLCPAVSSQLRHLSTIGKSPKQQYVLHMSPQYMANFGRLTAEIGSGVWGTPANFNWFRVLPSLLQRRRSPEASGQSNFARCLAMSCAGTLYIHFRGSCPWWNFPQCKIHFTSKSCFRLYLQRYCTAFQQRASAKLCGVGDVVQGMELWNFRRGRHLYSARRPSRWTSAHILVPLFCLNTPWTHWCWKHQLSADPADSVY